MCASLLRLDRSNANRAGKRKDYRHYFRCRNNQEIHSLESATSHRRLRQTSAGTDGSNNGIAGGTEPDSATARESRGVLFY